MARAGSMRAKSRRRWRGRGGGGAALAAVAAAWLSARRRAALGGSCLDDGAPRWGVTARRWFGVKGLPSPPRAIGRLIRTHLGKESAACPHFAALLPCAALLTCAPAALLPPWALLACAVLLLAGAPPELCWWLTWRGCWCCDQDRRNLRPHLHPRRSRCAPLRSSRRPRRPAGPDRPRETVFGFCRGTGSTVGVSGAAQSSASLLMGLSR